MEVFVGRGLDAVMQLASQEGIAEEVSQLLEEFGLVPIPKTIFDIPQ